jgi:hypothetical protein
VYPTRCLAVSVVAFAAVGLALAACSSTSTPPAKGPTAVLGATSHSAAAEPAGCHADITPQICVTVSITGAATAAGTAQTTAPAPPDASPDTTCAQLAAWDDTEMDLGGNLPDVAGHTVQWDEDLGNFHGPGTYDLAKSGFYVTVDGTAFMAYQDQAASVTVQPDYGVSYAFTKLTSDSGSVSGTVKWTCLDPS